MQRQFVSGNWKLIFVQFLRNKLEEVLGYINSEMSVAHSASRAAIITLSPTALNRKRLLASDYGNVIPCYIVNHSL